jgi:hypothetical protein
MQTRLILGLFTFFLINSDLIAQTKLIIDTQPEIITDTTIFMVVDTMPEFIDFKGKDTKERLENFINSQIQWPSQDDCIGKIFIQVVVEKDGDLSNYRIIRGLDSCTGFNDEAMRVVKLIPRFKPGKLNGKFVRVYFVIPVKFAI